GVGDTTTCQADPVNGVDQRGQSRPLLGCDIGAYDTQPGPVTPTPTSTATPTATPTATLIALTPTPLPTGTPSAAATAAPTSTATPTASATATSNSIEDTFTRPNQTGWGTTTNNDGVPSVAWGLDGNGTQSYVTISTTTGLYGYPG